MEQKLTFTADFLANHPVFSAFDNVILQAISERLTRVEIEESDILLALGEPGDAMYILETGLLKAYFVHPETGNRVDLSLIQPGALVGELSLISGQPRNATVEAQEHSVLHKLSKQSLEQVIELHPELEVAISAYMQPSIERKQLGEALERLLGCPVNKDTIEDLQASSEWISVLSGDVLFHENDIADSLFIVISGRLITKTTDINGFEVSLGEISAGQTLGEYAALTKSQRTATAYAIRDTNLIKVQVEAIQRVMTTYPQAFPTIMKNLVNRHIHNFVPTKTSKTRATTLCFIPLDPVTQSIDLFETIGQALSQYGKTLILTAERFDNLYGNSKASQIPFGHPLNNLITHWLNAREQEYQFIIYIGDRSRTSWTQRSMRQADRILLLASPEDTPSDPQDWEQRLLSGHANTHVDLILVNENQPTIGANRWLPERDLEAIFHLDPKSPTSMNRMARILSGNAVGLVLAGGGARGMSHVGAIRALEENGYDVDYVAGTSMGALVAGVYAQGASWQDMQSLARQFSDPKLIKDPTFPVTAMMSGRKVTRILKALYGEDTYIEDLTRKFFCIASNLSRSRPEIFHSGILWESVRASMAIPSIFPPMMHNGDVLVDGALMNNFPLDIMRRQIGGGTIIGINVNPRSTKSYKPYTFGPSISGWRVLASRINPFSKSIRVPSINGVVMRSMFVNADYQLRSLHGLADIMITPPVSEYGVLAYDKYDSIVEKGYQAGQMALEQLNAA